LILSLCAILYAQSITFPAGFQIGTATASYQVEGAWNKDGRGLTIWDTFSHEGHCYQNATGDVADDHYDRVAEDLQLMKGIGVQTYRMSLAWSRIFPTGKPPLNQAGVDHYNAEINALLAAGIIPHVTLFHWDLPSGLETEYGDGWLKPETSDAFAVYADTCFQLFGDRIKNWLTLNEPHTVAMNGYCYGSHAPGRCSDRTICPTGNSATEPYIAAHNMLLAHAKAVDVYRKKYQTQQKGTIGIVLDCTWYEPNTTNPVDVAAANRALEFYAAWYADPVFKGDYPDSMKMYVGNRLPVFTDAEKQLLKGSADFYALNHYTSRWATPNPNPTGQGPDADSHTNTFAERNGQLIGPQADSNWLYVVPYGIRKNLFWLQDRYGRLDFWITENGVDVPNESAMPLNQALNDTFRVNYYNDYLTELSHAIYDTTYKVNVKGYFAWSLMDNFEWNDGYNKRFGIHYVDYKNSLTRYQKNSAKFFKNLIANCCK
jgi:beta-glucosidase